MSTKDNKNKEARLGIGGKLEKLLGLGFLITPHGFSSNMTQGVCDFWSPMWAYDGWACSIDVHAFRGKVQDPVR
jgi:hypothetical protein